MKSTTLCLLCLAALILGLSSCSREYGETDMELQSILDELVGKNRRVENCVLSVSSGDGSFSWSGAAGIADRSGGSAMTPETPYCIASITKLFTATVVMQLHEENALSVDDAMSTYLPDELIDGIHVFDGKDYSREITIRQLLSHSSGIADYYSEKSRGGRSLYEIFLEDPGRKWTVEQTIDWARRELEPNFAPGTDTSYSDTNFQLLGKIIESVTEMPLHDVYEERIFSPLGMDSTWLTGHPRRPGAEETVSDVYSKDKDISALRSNGSYWADGGIISTAGDCIAFMKALNAGELVEPETLAMMHEWRDWRFPLKYGFGTMRFELPKGANAVMKVPPLWGHSGSTGSFLYYSDDADLYFAGTLNQVAVPGGKPFSLIGEAFAVIVEDASAGG